MTHTGIPEFTWLLVLLYMHLVQDSCPLHLVNRKSMYFQDENRLNLLFETDQTTRILEWNISLHYAKWNLLVIEAICSLKNILTCEVRSLVFYTWRYSIPCFLLYIWAMLWRYAVDKCIGIWITESQNHRMVGDGRDLCGSSSPTLLPKQGHLQ